MKSAADFYVFEKWLKAPPYAFGGKNEEGVVPAEEKEAYWRIFSELQEVAKAALEGHPYSEQLKLRPKLYSRTRGSRGHRPTDLWVSICAKSADAFGYMPQIYVIASVNGLELGFAASISEDDYYDAETKVRNRTLIPFINSKLPLRTESIVSQIDNQLAEQGGWVLNRKTRLRNGDEGFSQFGSFAQLLRFLKSEGDRTGAGTICRQFSIEELENVDLYAEFEQALDNFVGLLNLCAPSLWDQQVLGAQSAVQKLVEEAPFNPEDEQDGKKKVWAEVAQRQGQSKFRKTLIEAYDATCCVTGTAVPDVLQAAHIRPYNGPSTNHVSNGLLLRADIHTLFDLKLIKIEPDTMIVHVSSSLMGTSYWTLNGQVLRMPSKKKYHPNRNSLEKHFQDAESEDEPNSAKVLGSHDLAVDIDS